MMPQIAAPAIARSPSFAVTRPIPLAMGFRAADASVDAAASALCAAASTLTAMLSFPMITMSFVPADHSLPMMRSAGPTAAIHFTQLTMFSISA